MSFKIMLGMVGAGLLLFFAIQFVPVQRTNPQVVSRPDWDSPQTEALVRRACMDCHSNETTWPWYSHVAPVSWLVSHDVSEGRSQMNLSELDVSANQLSRIVQKIGRAVENGQMPKSVYLPMHPAAQLTPQEKQALVDGLVKTLARPPVKTQ
jgi:hypothetical protein